MSYENHNPRKNSPDLQADQVKSDPKQDNDLTGSNDKGNFNILARLSHQPPWTAFSLKSSTQQNTHADFGKSDSYETSSDLISVFSDSELTPSTAHSTAPSSTGFDFNLNSTSSKPSAYEIRYLNSRFPLLQRQTERQLHCPHYGCRMVCLRLDNLRRHIRQRHSGPGLGSRSGTSVASTDHASLPRTSTSENSTSYEIFSTTAYRPQIIIPRMFKHETHDNSRYYSSSQFERIVGSFSESIDNSIWDLTDCEGKSVPVSITVGPLRDPTVHDDMQAKKPKSEEQSKEEMMKNQRNEKSVILDLFSTSDIKAEEELAGSFDTDRSKANSDQTSTSITRFNDEPPKVHINAIGKASPYSPESQFGESETSCETDSDSSEDSHDSTSPCRLDFNDRQQNLFKQTLKIFWCVWNKKNFMSIVLSSIRMRAGSAPGVASSKCATQSASSSLLVSSGALGPGGSSGKRKRSEGDDDDLDDDPNQGSKPPRRDTKSSSGERYIPRYACVYRKHNPRKYNMYSSTWKACAISSFESVSRVKEHLYRKHKAPLQCPRCWIFFKCQEDLDLHLSIINFCEVRPGQRVEGVNDETMLKLKNRTRASTKQCEEERWKRMYGIIFPHEEIPSPFFEPVSDDLAQFQEPSGLPIEELWRQRLPQLISDRLQSEIMSIDLGNDNSPSADLSRLRDIIVTRIPKLINKAIEDVTSTYPYRSLANDSVRDVMQTPPSSSVVESNQPMSLGFSIPASSVTSLPETGFQSGEQQVDFLTSPPIQYLNTQDLPSNDNATQNQFLWSKSGPNRGIDCSRHHEGPVSQATKPDTQSSVLPELRNNARSESSHRFFEQLPLDAHVDWEAEFNQMYGDDPSYFIDGV